VVKITAKARVKTTPAPVRYLYTSVSNFLWDGCESNVDEPGLPGTNYGGIYFGLWANEKNAGICAWNARNTPSFQVVGDPLVIK
jgi:hypothetical protein